jgi:glutamate dehydrogenase
MLLAEADLLWFGGIGTYVKSSVESHADAGDRSNDAVRVDGHELRCKVIGEGANLGCTQLGRIEFARHGGRINTDFIDNSAGVDCSDHEVNIKIALGDVVQRGDMTLKQRDRLLESMTDEVAALVLRDNYQQTQAISLAEAQSFNLIGQQQRFMRSLERAGLLDRDIEYLPNDEEIADRLAAKHGLRRPELAVLLAYSKIATFDEILSSDLPDEPLLGEELLRYFPTPLREGYAEAIQRHRLRREIIATVVTNSMINRAGATFVNDMKEATGLPTSEIARAYIIARDAFELRPLWEAVEALDNRVAAQTQTDMLLEIDKLLNHATLWFLRCEEHPLDITRNMKTFAAGIHDLRGCIDKIMGTEDRGILSERANALIHNGVPDDLANEIAKLDVMASACDIVRIAVADGRSIRDVGAVYFGLGTRFGIDWLRGQAESILPDNPWQQRAIDAIVDDLFSHQGMLTSRVLDSAGKTKNPEKMIENWAGKRKTESQRVEELIADLRAASVVDVSMLAVANREVRNLIGP